MRRFANHVLAVGSALAVMLLAARDAAACSCVSASFVVNPEAGVRHVPGLPLVHYSNVATATLQDGAGTELALTAIREVDVSGVCGGTVRFLAPSVPLEPNANYTIVPLPEFVDQAWVEEHTVSFATGSAPVTRAPLRLELAATLLSHEPYESASSGCADPAFDGRVIGKTLSVVLTPSSPAMLFVTVWMDDAIAGRLADTGSTWDGGGKLHSGAGASMPMPDDAPDCVDVSVADASGEELLAETLCPELNATASVTRDVTAVVLPEAPKAHDAPGRGSSGCGISRSSSARNGILMLTALLVLSSSRRRVRKRDSLRRSA